jgi:hypothetical protein
MAVGPARKRPGKLYADRAYEGALHMPSERLVNKVSALRYQSSKTVKVMTPAKQYRHFRLKKKKKLRQ